MTKPSEVREWVEHKLEDVTYDLTQCTSPIEANTHKRDRAMLQAILSIIKSSGVMFECIDCGKLSSKLGLCECHKPQESRDILAVPRPFVEYCIRTSDSEEHRKALRELLENDCQGENPDIIFGDGEVSVATGAIPGNPENELIITRLDKPNTVGEVCKEHALKDTTEVPCLSRWLFKSPESVQVVIDALQKILRNLTPQPPPPNAEEGEGATK